MMEKRNVREKVKIAKLVEDGKLEEAFKELRKLPKFEVERIWKIVVKEPVIPLEKEKTIYEIIKQLRMDFTHQGGSDEGRGKLD